MNYHSLSSWKQISEWWDVSCTLISVTFAAGKHWCVCHLCLPSQSPVSASEGHIGKSRQWYQTHSCERVLSGEARSTFGSGAQTAGRRKSSEEETVFQKDGAVAVGFVWDFSTLLWFQIPGNKQLKGSLCALFNQDQDIWSGLLSCLKNFSFRWSQPSHCSISSWVF